MGARVLEWSTAHPDPTPGYAAAISRLKDLVTRADQLASQQRDGILEVRRATARKRAAREEITQTHFSHILSVAELASVEEPELAEKFRMPGRITTYSAFRTAARGVLTEAQNRKELLVKYGLSETVLEALKQSLDSFEGFIEQSTQGRAAHVGASSELENVGEEIVQYVRVLDGIYRHGLANDGELLSAWESTSSVLAIPRSSAEKPGTGETPPGQIKPAA